MEATNGWKVRRKSDDKRVERGWKVCRGQMCDCAGWQLLGWETGQDKSSQAGCTDTWYCLVSPFTEHCYRIPSQGSVSGHDKSSSAGEADGAVVKEHGTSLPGTAWTWHCDTGVHMGIIVKFSEALPCVKSPVSRTAGTIYVVT